MKKVNDKTTVGRLFNGLLGEQRRWSSCKVLLCLFVFLSGTVVYAQSNDSISIVFEKVPVEEEYISNDGLPERDLDMEAILPAAMYDVSNENLLLVSPHVTFESVTYYIMDANGIIVATDEIILLRNIEQTIDISLQPAGVYRILLEICGEYFIGELIKND